MSEQVNRATLRLRPLVWILTQQQAVCPPLACPSWPFREKPALLVWWLVEDTCFSASHRGSLAVLSVTYPQLGAFTSGERSCWRASQRS